MPFGTDTIEDKLAMDFICVRLSGPDRVEKELRICATVHEVLGALRSLYAIDGPLGLRLYQKVVNYAGPGSERIMVLAITGKSQKCPWVNDIPDSSLNVILFEVDEAKEEFTGRFWIDSHLSIPNIDAFSWEDVDKHEFFSRIK